MHIPVLQKEVLKYLDPKPNENFIDCTTGEGGHTLSILEKNGPTGKVLGIEIDCDLYKKLLRLNLDRLTLVNDSYLNLKEIVERKKFNRVYGILFDLGISSWHLEESKRGFSFLQNEPLDMRYDLNNPLTAEKIVNYWSGQEIGKILENYGEEKFAEKIAREIVKRRRIKPIKTTFQLVEIIKKAVPNRYFDKKIHFATKTFQALRIAVNDELNNLERALPQALEILERNGRLVVISFHSLEDRIVKNFLKSTVAASGKSAVLTKKPIQPTYREVKINPRSRSAKLRAAIKTWKNL
jgi:16S rRNA (cytosine1402-N4)-methyltransferase